jgi:hypothetical protein
LPWRQTTGESRYKRLGGNWQVLWGADLSR